MALGLYGAFACLKFHERCAFHIGQARGLRKKIAEQFPDLQIEAALRASSREQRGRFPRLRRILLHMVRIALHGAIAAAGAAPPCASSCPDRRDEAPRRSRPTLYLIE
jgi:hypothetical protein